jgi:hypothetical protein
MGSGSHGVIVGNSGNTMSDVESELKSELEVELELS